MTSGQRNVRKRNPKRVATVEEQLRSVKSSLEELSRKPNKTPADILELDKLRARVKHLSKKRTEKSELHARQGERH
jgi:TolA-binding protein